MVSEDQDRIRLAYSLAFSLPGTPVLFYGEEIGMRESLEIPGRLSVRSPMQWSSERSRGFTTARTPVRDPAVFAHRADWEGSAIVAVHSLAAEPREVVVEVGDAETAVDLFGPDELRPRGGRIAVELGRYRHRWFRLRRPGEHVAP